MALFMEPLERDRALRRERVLRDRQDPFAFPDNILIKRYRLPRGQIEELTEVLRADMTRPTNRSNAVPVELQIAAALRFYATGSFQSVTGDGFGLSQPTLSRIITSFTNSLVRRVRDYVYLRSDDVDRRAMVQEFAEVRGFPNVVGVIDGTHVAIKSPVESEFLYVNRKNYHSINVQLMCDKNYFIMDVVSKWPGSTHDSFILENSGISQILQDGRILGDGWILGDSGYPLKPWLLTPLREPRTPAERRYNQSHKTTRCIVERCIGVLKSRFRCLDRSGGTLQYDEGKCCKIIVASVILHNICIRNRVPLAEEVEQAPDSDGEDDDNNDAPGTTGVATRQRLINDWFQA